MNAYRVKIGNNMDWISEGAINVEIFAFASSLEEAIVVAGGVVEDIRDQLRNREHDRELTTLRVHSVVEVADVTGSVGTMNGIDRSTLISEIVHRLSKRKESV